MSRRDGEGDERVALSGVVVACSAKSVLVRVGDLEAWLPRSVSDELEEVSNADRGASLDFELPRWLARDRGLEP